MVGRNPTANAYEPHREFNPRVAAKNSWARIEAFQRLKALVASYRQAWSAWTSGDSIVGFSPGTNALARIASVKITTWRPGWTVDPDQRYDRQTMSELTKTEMADLFRENLLPKNRKSIPDNEALSGLLSTAWRDIQSSRSPLDLSAQAFLVAVASMVDNKALASDDLKSLNWADLYLALACGNGEEKAISLFQKEYAKEIVAVLRKRSYSDDIIDETTQSLFERLFVGRKGAQPSILKYAGRGTLLAWVRTAAIRAAIDLSRKSKRYLPVGDELLDFFDRPTGDPELDRIKVQHRADFKAAAQAALAELDDEDRQILKQYYLEGVITEKLGEILGVHRATAARRLNRLTENLGIRINELLKEKLNLNTLELQSLMRLVHTQIDLSLNRVLKPEDG